MLRVLLLGPTLTDTPSNLPPPLVAAEAQKCVTEGG